MKPAPTPSRTPQVLSAIGYGAFLLFALGVGTVFGWANRNAITRDIIFHPLSFLNKDPKPAFGGQDSETLLILGCDEDRFYRGVKLHGKNVYKQFARSDMMLVAKLDFAHNMITGISIPRDTMCNLPGWPGEHKINSYHEIAKESEADNVSKQAVEYLIPQVHIDKVVDIDFEAMQHLVDMVGGVTVTVPEKMDYDDYAAFLHIHLKPGKQHLDGYNAMGYVRFRHNSEGDFGRQQRQKDLLAAFKDSAFHNLGSLPDVLTQGKAVLNFALNDDQLEALAAFTHRIPQDRIKMGMVPVVDGPGTFLLVDKKKLPETLAEYGFASTPQGAQPNSVQ